MQLRCPVCKADNASGPACRRCKADLSLLIAVESQREHHVAHCAQAAREGRLDDALEHLDQAKALRDGPDLRRYRVCMSVLAGDYTSSLAGL